MLRTISAHIPKPLPLESLFVAFLLGVSRLSRSRSLSLSPGFRSLLPDILRTRRIFKVCDLRGSLSVKESGVCSPHS